MRGYPIPTKWNPFSSNSYIQPSSKPMKFVCIVGVWYDTHMGYFWNSRYNMYPTRTSLPFCSIRSL